MVIGGVDGGTGRFCWAVGVLCCFVLCRDDKNVVVMYMTHIVQIIKTLLMWRRVRDDFSPVLVV